jgi:EpsI family protein
MKCSAIRAISRILARRALLPADRLWTRPGIAPNLTPSPEMNMPANRTGFAIAILMFAASVGAIVAKPGAKLANEQPALSLEGMVPKQFGDWREEPQRFVQVVNPQTQELLDKLYSQVLTRTYVNAGGYRILLSIAYGSDQRGAMQMHKPEVCYPAQGFVLEKNDAGSLVTALGEIPVRRLLTTLGPRREPVTYWFTIGDTAIRGKLEKRLADLRYGLTGRIPDGMLFRISSIDPDPAQAFRIQDQFVDQLLAAVSVDDRKRLSGLGGPP